MTAPLALADTYTTQADIQALMSSTFELNVTDDDNDGTQSAAELAAGTTKAISWATDRVNFYLQPLHKSSELTKSWLVNEWATILACYWLSTRRGNPPPASFDTLYKDCIKDLELCSKGTMHVPNIAHRDSQWPAWSNVRVNPYYALRKVRVERGISERTATPYKQNLDRAAEVIVEP